MKAELIIQGNFIKFYTPYDRSLVWGMKSSINPDDRRPVFINDKFKYWAVDVKHKDTLINLVDDHLGYVPKVIQQSGVSGLQTKVLEIRYLGGTVGS